MSGLEELVWGVPGGRWRAGATIGVTVVAGIVVVLIVVASTRRGGLKSPWHLRRQKAPLNREEWKSCFTPEGKLLDGGLTLLKKIRSGGVDPSIRAEVWPYLLGVYDLECVDNERIAISTRNRQEYLKLRKHCLKKTAFGCVDKDKTVQVKQGETPVFEESELDGDGISEVTDPATEHFFASNDTPDSSVYKQMEVSTSTANEDGFIVKNSASEDKEVDAANDENLRISSSSFGEEEDKDKSDMAHVATSDKKSEPVESVSSVEEELESILTYAVVEGKEIDHEPNMNIKGRPGSTRTVEDFPTWQRIIRLDAIRANDEWVPYSPKQAAVSTDKAIEAAKSVNLVDYEHLEAHRIYHAARLVAVLEAYAVYDPEIGYCQGMSDLLGPMLAVLEEDHEAFWCFAGFMRKARHNFRLDEVGIRRQLSMVSKIIKYKDVGLYKHLENLQAEDCFFVYRMVVVMFRRELTFEQTLYLWEVMWADQAANRVGIGKSAWGNLRMGPPPTDDLLLFAIAASVLQKRKLIIEKYHSMDEIIRECNGMAGNLDIWKLLDDAHDLVVTLHDKIQ